MTNIFGKSWNLPADRPARILFLHTLLATAETAEDCTRQLEELLAGTKPDFVLFGGDITEKQDDADGLEKLLAAVFTPVTRRGLPWAHVFGDRDRIGAVDGETQMRLYQRIPGCCSVSGADAADGCGNYILPLCRGGEPVFFLWCMDSHDHVEGYEKAYGSPTRARLASPLYTEYYNDGIRFGQTMWYHHTSLALEERYGRKIPGLLCFHIPTPEHVLVVRNQQRTNMTGVQHEPVSCHTVNGGIFSAVFERRDVHTILCGNGRRNQYSGTYGGITLAQTHAFRETGKGALLEIGLNGAFGIEL